jgi:hypothetical protein
MQTYNSRFRACCALPAVFAASLLAAPAAAQLAPSPGSLGMGGANVAGARGHEAIFANPANLGLPGNPYWSVASPGVLVTAGVAGPSLGQTLDIMRGAGGPETAELLALVPADGMQASLDVRAPLFTMQSRRFAFAAAWGAVADHGLGRDLVDLYLNGYETGRTDYRADDTSGSRASFYTFSLAHGRRIGPVSLGVTGRYVLGRYISSSRLFDPVYDVAGESLDVEYREVFARGGNGWGVDVGAAMQPIPGLTLSAAILDAAGEMRWSEELHTRSLSITQDDFGAPERHWEERFTQFSRGSEPVDPSGAPITVYETANGLYDRAHFPATLRTGAAYQLAGSGTTLAASYSERLGDGRLGSAWERTASAGVQQRIPLVTLRAGYATDMADGSLLAGGVRLGALDVAAARIRDARESGAPREGWVGSIGLSIGTTTRMP